jgi:hypothetical protein
MACSSASVIIQPQVNSTVRRRVDRDSRWVTRSWLAPAPSIRISSFDRHRAGELGECRGQHLDVVADGAGPGVAGAQEHRQRLLRIGAPGTERMEAVAFLVL